jgi:predicted P-loop ATPase
MPADPPVQDVRDAVEVIADDNPYDPLVEYMLSLPKFIPPDNYNPDESLLSTWLEKVGATPGPDTKKFARRILLGLVARALRPGVKFDYVPVFEGPQGVGKSSLVKALVSPAYYATLFGGLASKDAPMTLRGRWAVELAELVAFKKTDNETMKSFFSTDTDVFRPPYARNLVTIQRRTVLFGTTNDSQYLTDHTGSRRYWSIYFGVMINISWFIEHRDILFAEAMHFFEKGERFHDTLEESNSPHRQKQMQARLVTPAWQIKLLQHLQNLPKPRPPDKDGLGSSGVITHHTVAALQDVLSLPPSIAHMNAAQLVTFLQRAGYLPLRLSYRPSDGGQPTKLNVWCHPAIHRLTPDQQRAFLALFPTLFKGGAAPAAWTLMQPEFLEAATEGLRLSPEIMPLDFNSDTE